MAVARSVEMQELGKGVEQTFATLPFDAMVGLAAALVHSKKVAEDEGDISSVARINRVANS